MIDIPSNLTDGGFWEDSNTFERNHPTLVELGTALGLTEAELDMMFINASKL